MGTHTVPSSSIPYLTDEYTEVQSGEVGCNSLERHLVAPEFAGLTFPGALSTVTHTTRLHFLITFPLAHRINKSQPTTTSRASCCSYKPRPLIRFHREDSQTLLTVLDSILLLLKKERTNPFLSTSFYSINIYSACKNIYSFH